MPKKRRQFSSVFKAKVALEAVRGERAINEIAAEYLLVGCRRRWTARSAWRRGRRRCVVTVRRQSSTLIKGSQYTSEAVTSVLLDHGVQISMDSKGRVIGNVFVERLWRSGKYEDVYLKGYATMKEVKAGLKGYFRFYNEERFHQQLDDRTPDEVYYIQGGEMRCLIHLRTTDH